MTKTHEEKHFFVASLQHKTASSVATLGANSSHSISLNIVEQRETLLPPLFLANRSLRSLIRVRFPPASVRKRGVTLKILGTTVHTLHGHPYNGEKKRFPHSPPQSRLMQRENLLLREILLYSAHRDYVTHRTHQSKSGISSSTTSQQAFLDHDAPRAVRRLSLGGPGEEVRGPPPAHSQGSCHFQVKLMFSVHTNSP